MKASDSAEVYVWMRMRASTSAMNINIYVNCMYKVLCEQTNLRVNVLCICSQFVHVWTVYVIMCAFSKHILVL